MFRILHFSDLHLETSFAGAGMTPSVAAQRREELRSALRRILSKAGELNVDAITIGGDLYEHDRVTADTANFLKAQFEAAAPTPIIISPGNHDPYVIDSLWRQVQWPPNVFVFSESRLTPYQLDESGITFWGAGHDSPALRTNLLSNFRASEDGCHILLLHASDITSVPPGKAAHCPFSPEEIRTAGFRFALLGHYHKGVIAPERDPYYSYPGSPEPLGFDEEGDHYVLLLEISEAEISPSLEIINSTDYRQIKLDVSNALSRQDIINRINGISDEQNLGRSIVRIMLEGMLHQDVDLDLAVLLNECNGKFRFLDIRNSSDPAYDVETIKDEPTSKGAFVRKMLRHLEECSEEERETVRLALIYGLQAFDSRQIHQL